MREQERCCSEGLQLRSIPHPARPREQVRFFGDLQQALGHLRDHVLTAPECEAWALVDARYLQLLDLSDGKARLRYARQAEASAGRSAQPLYDVYRDAVACDAEDAALLGWYRSQGTLTVALGTSGVLLLIDGPVRTAFLPGQGDPSATRQSERTEGLRLAIVRERGMRSGRHGRGGSESWERDRQVRARREAAWSPDQRLYYRVFKPAVQFVKRCQHRCRDMFGRLTRGDYALVKEAIPHLSQLKLDDWLRLRARCGRGN